MNIRELWDRLIHPADYRPEFHARYVTRPRKGPCPACGVDAKTWCEAHCPLIDPTDYR